MAFNINSQLNGVTTYTYFDETSEVSYLKPKTILGTGSNGTVSATIDGTYVSFPVDIPLYSTTNLTPVTSDIFCCKNGIWGIERYLNTVVYDGSEDWQKRSDNIYYLPAPEDAFIPYWNNTRQWIQSTISTAYSSNMAVYQYNNYISIGKNSTGLTSTSPPVVGFTLNNTVTTVEEFKSILSNLNSAGTPVTVLYQLSEPVWEALPIGVQMYLNYLLYGDIATAVKQGDKISIYDMSETDFSHFGLRILTPTSCKITEELNGMYELEMEHVVDTDGAWKSLVELNLIKAKGQIFRIYRKVKKMNADGTKSVSINAKHIFYDLGDKMLEDVRPTDCAGQACLDWIMSHIFTTETTQEIDEGYHWYCSSDIETINTSYFEMVSPVSAFIGADNCFLNRWGGELYRDNFYFSINQRRENSVDNAFYIRYGMDMFEVEETIDYSNFCSYLLTTNNYGYGAAWHVGVPIPHHFIKHTKFTYDEGQNITEQQIADDSMNYFSEINYPAVSYTVRFAELAKLDEYKDFFNLQRCNIGDTGVIYSEQLGINTTQKVVKKVYDVVNDCVDSIELGNIRNQITRKGRYSNTVSDGQSQNDKLQEQLRDTRKKLISSSIGTMEEFTIKELERYTINELEGN